MEKQKLPDGQAKESTMPAEKTSSVKGTETARQMRKLVKRIYSQAREYKMAGKPVAWAMGAALHQDILGAMDIAGCYPENYSALCATKRVEMPFLERAEADGYSRFLCGYSRLTLGFAYQRHESGIIPPDAPDGGMADPDMLVCSSNLCEPRYKWFQSLERYYPQVPRHCIDVVYPPSDREIDDLQDYYIKYQVQELRELVAFVEKVVGRKMDRDRLCQCVDNTCKTMELVNEIYQLRQAVPCPMPSQDWWAGGVPFQFISSDPEAIQFYTALRDELKQKVESHIGVIPHEKYRLLWAGLPPWHHMNIFNYFESLGAVFPAELTYYVSWHPGKAYQIKRNEGDDPLEVIARSNLKRWTTWHKAAKEGCGYHHAQMILDLIRDYKIDGFVIHFNNSCRVCNIGHIHASLLAREKFGIPVLVLESDIIDTRDYSDVRMKRQIDVFVETVEAYQGKRRGV